MTERQLPLPELGDKSPFSPEELRETVDYWAEWHEDETTAELLELDMSGPRIVCGCCGVTYRGPLTEGGD